MNYIIIYSAGFLLKHSSVVQHHAEHTEHNSVPHATRLAVLGAYMCNAQVTMALGILRIAKMTGSKCLTSLSLLLILELEASELD